MNDWLFALCGDETLHTLSTPFPTEIEGTVWNCATNGQGMVLVKRVPPCPEIPVRENAPDAKSIFPQKADEPIVARYADLAQWCGCSHEATKRSACAKCEGVGVVYCEFEYEHECPDCDGNGEVRPCEPPKPGNIAGVNVNRRLLWAYLGAIPDPGEYVQITGANDWMGPVRIDGDGWIVLVMGMRSDENIEIFEPKKESVA